MPLSSKVRDRCRPYLGTGERIQYLIPGMSLYVNRMHARVGFLVMVTDRHVTLLACSRWTLNRPKQIWERLPRDTELGPLEIHPSLGPILSVGGIDLEIDEEYIASVRAANLEVSGDALPEDPYPGG
ncbi:hypothetical protein DMA12_38730 [Amycolatopsis balhimycina DSM 5908]|uniref:Uncharacterized protein n=1 Tax=Amycolatopsis balhimycina DSM 5908 TaxID=1081091 RepID=A0A428W1E3_AMYBA|nr:hypothetical protein [Amycolatopsis balhimycina]RSM36898.1 hypothetical protein DMA12_38730 [Amycolatopsis balhimycina DSM 5908]